jgi:hypothetical protein
MMTIKRHEFIISNKSTELDGAKAHRKRSAGKDALRVCAAEIGRPHDAMHKANFRKFSTAQSNLD